MPLGWEITFAILSAIAALFAIGATCYEIYKHFHNNLNTKNFTVEYIAKAPAIEFGHSRPYVKVQIIFHNKTERNLLITKLELVDGNNVFDIKGGIEPYFLNILAKTKISLSYGFEIRPPKYLLPPQCKLKIYVGDKVLSYTVKTNSKELPY